MNVLHINLNFYESGLYESFSESLINQGCNLTVFHPTIEQSKNEIIPSYLESASILDKYDRYFFKRRNDKIIEYMKNQKDCDIYDVLHAHSLFSNGYIAYTLKRLYNIPYIVAVRNTDINHFFKRRILLRGLGVKILKNAEKIIMLSEPYKIQMIKNYIPTDIRNEIEEKIKIIPNGINDFWHKNINYSDDNKPGSKIKILSVGVVNKNKNILTSIKACEKLIKSGKDVELTVIGEAENYNILKKIKKYKFVKYFPKISKEELLKHYRKSNIFLMPSVTETFGLVYAEAMSQGLPVLYSKGQGFDKQFKDGTVGYAVEKTEPEDIADKILLTLNNYDKISKNCINLVSKFDWDEISKEYILFYENIYKDNVYRLNSDN